MNSLLSKHIHPLSSMSIETRVYCTTGQGSMALNLSKVVCNQEHIYRKWGIERVSEIIWTICENSESFWCFGLEKYEMKQRENVREKTKILKSTQGLRKLLGFQYSFS